MLACHPEQIGPAALLLLHTNPADVCFCVNELPCPADGSGHYLYFMVAAGDVLEIGGCGKQLQANVVFGCRALEACCK